MIAGPDGAARALVGVCHDITDRARAEEALGASQRRTRAIIDNTPSVITVKDLEDRFLMANSEAERIIGIPAEKLIGMRCVDVFPPTLAASQRTRDERAASENEAVYGEETLLREGEPRDFITVTFPVRDENQLPIETCTIATDVTERKERESERRERLRWRERLQAGADASRRALEPRCCSPAPSSPPPSAST